MVEHTNTYGVVYIPHKFTWFTVLKDLKGHKRSPPGTSESLRTHRVHRLGYSDSEAASALKSTKKKMLLHPASLKLKISKALYLILRKLLDLRHNHWPQEEQTRRLSHAGVLLQEQSLTPGLS